MLMQAVESYLAIRRAVGFKLRLPSYLLRSFARFAGERGEQHVQTATAITWATKAPSVAQRDTRLKTVIRFARHARAEDPLHEVPPDHVFAAPLVRRLPYLFTADELQRILDAAARLGPPGSLRPHVYWTLLGLIAACGLRLSEAIALQLDDLTPDGLIIRETKFHKCRLVPLHETTEQALRSYLRRRRRIAGATTHIFVSGRLQPLNQETVRYAWWSLLQQVGLCGAPGSHTPRIHDLRHVFAIRSLEDCPAESVDQHRVALSTYLGHVHLRHTYWYQRATPVLLGDIADQCRSYLEGGHA